jgi:hypothetical protein
MVAAFRVLYFFVSINLERGEKISYGFPRALRFFPFDAK